MGPVFELEVESLDLDGRGVAHREGKAVFIEGALPGERVLYERSKSKARYEMGRTVQVLRASAMRQTPRCSHFGFERGACGGCAMQHLHPSAQVAVKQRVLEDSLWHVGRLRAETLLPPVHGPAWGYRYRARLSVRAVARKGCVLVGFRERGSSYVADMSSCAVLPPFVSELLLPLRELVGTLSIRDRVPQIELAVGAGGVVVLVFRILEAMSASDEQALLAFGQAQGVSMWVQPAGPESARPLEGPDDILALVLPEFGVRLPFGPTDFTQVNHHINEVLVGLAVNRLAPEAHDHVVDFFCGLGNFTLPLATRAQRVTGIEGAASLVSRACAAAAKNGLAGRAQFIQRNLFEWSERDWEALVQSRGAVQRVLIDPPREGALAVVQALARSALAPRRLVYVSCNPATLARDAAVLVHEGQWRLRCAGVINMFAHTAHVESMAVFEPAR